MKLHVLSDLHLEFGPITIPAVNADVVILAGDIHPGLKSLQWARSTFPDSEIVFVAGNHEYYRHALPDLTDKLIKVGSELGIHVLHNDSVVIDGVRFLGCTLWSDFMLQGITNPALPVSDAGLNDYKKIRVTPGYRKFRPVDAAALHAKSRRWLQHMVAMGATENAVVVTHHAPSMRSVRPGLQDEPSSAAYASHLDDFVAETRARLWIHGHTHYCVDYTIGDTRVCSNQRAYMPSPLPEFNPELVVDVATPAR